jgi:hypothetical protein
MLMEKRAHSVYLLQKIVAADSTKTKLKRHIDTVHAECAEKIPEFFQRKLK